MVFHQAGFGENERPGADPDQRNLLARGFLKVADRCVVDGLPSVQQSPYNDDIIELTGIDEIRCRCHLNAATGRDQVARASQYLPVGEDTAGPVGFVAGEPQRVDEQGKCRQREGAGEYEADLQLFGGYSFALRLHPRLHQNSTSAAMPALSKAVCKSAFTA